MFDHIGKIMGNFQLINRLMKDENFKALMMHPKFRGLMSDSAFQEILKTRDTQKINNHPKMLELMRDAEFKTLISKIDFKTLLS